jgi:hypothetical protein
MPRIFNLDLDRLDFSDGLLAIQKVYSLSLIRFWDFFEFNVVLVLHRMPLSDRSGRSNPLWPVLHPNLFLSNLNWCNCIAASSLHEARDTRPVLFESFCWKFFYGKS